MGHLYQRQLSERHYHLHILSGILLHICQDFRNLVYRNCACKKLCHVHFPCEHQIHCFFKLSCAGSCTANIQLFLREQVCGKAGFLLGPTGQSNSSRIRHIIQRRTDCRVCSGTFHNLLRHCPARDLMDYRYGVFPAGINDVFNSQ